MKPSIFLKTITLLFFASSITAFLLYRTGEFDSYLNETIPSLQTSSNGGTIRLSKTDSSRIFKLDSNQLLKTSTSKLVKITDFPGKSIDSIIAKRRQEAMRTKRVYMLSSSKSAQVVSFDDLRPSPEPYLMSSSKSLQVIRPILIKNPDSINAVLFPAKKKTN